MALNAKKVAGSVNKIKALDAGSYPARIVQIIDLGVQEQMPYQGEKKPDCNEIRIVYEMSDEFMLDDDGEELKDSPRWINEDIPLHNLSKDKSKSTKRYLALDPEVKFGGDFAKLVGSPCYVTVVQNPGKGANLGKVYANVAGISIMRAKDAEKSPPLVNPPIAFDLDEPNVDEFNTFPEWLKDKIKGGVNFEGSKLGLLLSGKPPVDEGPEEEEDW